MDLSDLVMCLMQGIGEFLPISSSAHMVIAEKLLNIQNYGLETHVILHFGSLLALLLYFFTDIFSMLQGVWMYDVKKRRSTIYRRDRDLVWKIVWASVPTVIIGFFVKKEFINIPNSLWLIGLMSVVFGVLMIISDVTYLKKKEITFVNAMMIGFAECLAVVPGVSRLGICLTMGRFVGVELAHAAKFSFLMAIPILLGAFVMIVLDSKNMDMIFSVNNLLPIIFVAILGMFTIKFFLKFAGSNFHFLKFFAFYRIVLGAIILYLF